MRKLLLIIGVVSMAACVLSLLFAAFNWFSYYHVLDGSANLYARLHQRMITGFAIGFVFAVIGVVLLIIHFKK